MFTSRWLNHLIGVAHSRKDRRRRAVQSRKPVRLVLESLEERLTPAGGTPTVTQTAGGYTALTAAVGSDTAANTNYVIQITGSFQFNSGGAVSITKLGSGSTMTIEGQNGTNFTLTGNGNRLFDVGSFLSSGQTVTFKDLTLTGGKVTATTIFGGGAIQDFGSNVTLSNVAVKGNTISGHDANGGGISISAPGSGSTASLTIESGSTIQSNRAIGTGTYTSSKGQKSAGSASGGGLYVNGLGGAVTVAISDSSISDNSAQGGQGANSTTAGAAGAAGGTASGGGMDFNGSCNVTLTGDTFAGNTAVGGTGGNGAAGSNGGDGGSGGNGGGAYGGAAAFLGSGNLTILNDLAAPSTDPSLMIGNSVQGGAGGNGGSGGTSTGTANNSDGGSGGSGGYADSGALYILTLSGTFTANIGNTTLYGNKATGGIGGVGGAAGTGGSAAAGAAGTDQSGGTAFGGAIDLSGVSSGAVTVTMVNSTVADNIATGGAGGGGSASQGLALGGGIAIENLSNSLTVILDNNTITQNSTQEASSPGVNAGGGIDVLILGSPVGSPPPATSSNPTLINNLIQGNLSNSTADDLDTYGTTLSSATNNFIGAMSANAVSTTSNTVGNTTVQLGSVVGVDAKGNPTGGPIYYPLLSGVTSIGAGSTSVLSTIAGVEGTTSANATDEIGNPRSSSNSIDLGAVQTQSSGSTSAPTITTPPSNQTAVVGGTATFMAAAGGNPTPTVQWQFSSNGGKTFAPVSNATSPTLTLNSITAAMNGYEYEAVFTNSAGSITSNAATLTVTASTSAPVVTTNPSSVSLAVGQNAVFTVAANGSPTPGVQWQISTDGGKTFANINGATSTTLAVNDVALAMNGDEYRAAFSNSAGSVFTGAATLSVHSNPLPPPPAPPSPPPPPPVEPPVLQLIEGLLSGLGGTTTLTVNANGAETITDSVFGFPLLTATFNSSGHFEDATLLGFDITFLINLFT